MAALRLKLIAAGIAVPFTIERETDTPGETIVLSGEMLPMTAAEAEAYRRGLISKNTIEFRAAQLAKHMKTWNVPEGDCRDPKSLLALPTWFFDALEGRITGFSFSPEQGADDHKSGPGGPFVAAVA
jgi:hypothetical protein